MTLGKRDFGHATARQGTPEGVNSRFLDSSMGREQHNRGVGGLLSIPSTKLEPRMDASAKVQAALPTGFVLLIPRAHTRAIFKTWTRRQICNNQALKNKARSLCPIAGQHCLRPW